MNTFLKLGGVLYISILLSRHSPELAFAFVVFCLAVSLFRRLFIFIARPFFLGLFAGWGLRESGLLKQFRAPRTRRQARTCFPWEERGDDLPPEL